MKRLSVLGTVALLALAGCGGGNDNSSSSTSTSSGSSTSASGGSSSGGGGGQQLALSAPASGALKFDKSKLTAKAGKVTITMTNQSSVPHDIAIKGGASGQGNVVTSGGKSVVTLDLKPGKYTFYCSVDGHEAAGMNGELDVQ
jgi:plastocyanin